MPTDSKSSKLISIRGAREHNLKGIDLDLPREKLIAVTGVSGSGKSTLVFDTLIAECKRRFIDSLSPSARQFLEQIAKPDVDSITGLSPAVAIEAFAEISGPRATVGTISEIYHYFQVMFSRIGVAFCPNCAVPIERHSVQAIVNQIADLPENTRVILLAPLTPTPGQSTGQLLDEMRSLGYVRVRINGEVRPLEEELEAAETEISALEVVIDRLQIKSGIGNRISDSVELALKTGNGAMIAAYETADGYLDRRFSEQYSCAECGCLLPEVKPQLFSYSSPHGACPVCNGVGRLAESFTECPDCGGSRLRPEAQLVRIGNTSIADIAGMSLLRLQQWIGELAVPPAQQDVLRPLAREIADRVSFLIGTGLEYLSLSRSASSISPGEMQRIRLASQLGAALSGVIYALDEPSVGLHARDAAKLYKALEELRDLGNTVIVVEHDPAIFAHCDQLIELGPGPGAEGGRLMLQGPPAEVLADPASLSSQARTKQKSGPKRRNRGQHGIAITGAHLHTLKGVDVELPLKNLVCITGVAGSGKSSLITDTLAPAIRAWLSDGKLPPGLPLRSISGFEAIDALIAVDQSPIGRSPRSNPATYVNAFNPLRDLFSQLPEARARGYTPSRFSFNVKGGRCEHCEGAGALKVEMVLMSDVYVTCPECAGQRYNRDTLEIKYRGNSIADVLNMGVGEAHQLLIKFPQIEAKLRSLVEVGLGYLRLGQSATALSGGEAQRVKLAAELGKKPGGHTLFVFDEPSRGLHSKDVTALLDVLQRLVDVGHSVVVIEHNLELIAAADWCIDLGPEGGEGGGQIVFAGVPEDLAQAEGSYTGQYLRRLIS